MPIANNDAFTTGDNVTFSGNVFADNGAGADDGGGGALTIAAVNGNAASVGNQITLASGSRLKLTADGTFTYIPWTGFQEMPVAGASPNDASTAFDSFTYRLTTGETATVKITINGLDNNDRFVLTLAGSTIIGGSGDDLFRWGRFYRGSVDGGDGYDRILFSEFNLNLASSSISRIEEVFGTYSDPFNTPFVSMRADQFADIKLISGFDVQITSSGAVDISGIRFDVVKDGIFPSSNRLTIGSSQSGLFRTSGSGSSLVVTNADGLTSISFSERMRLYGLGYNLEFAASGNRVLSSLGNSGGVVTESVTDTAGTETWTSRVTTLNYFTQSTTAQTLILDDGNTQVFFYSNGILTQIVETDTDDDDDFVSITTTYAADGMTITGKTILLDNGNTQVVSYAGGIPTQMVETQILPDGNMLATTFVSGVTTQTVETDSDSDDNFVSIATTYAADGVTITGRTILLDNGNTQVVSYAGGVATQMVETQALPGGNMLATTFVDGLATQSVETDANSDDDFATITTTYAADGATITGKTILLDNGHTQVVYYSGGVPAHMVETQVLPDGNTLVTTFVNGLATQSVETDTDSDDDFVSITTTYAADSATITGKTILLDNGNTQVVSYAGGIPTQMVETDSDNDDDFVSITTTYAANGTTITGKTILLDNGNTKVVSYAGGIPTQMVETDSDNDESFASITTTYTADGATINFIGTAFDDGASSLRTYETDGDWREEFRDSSGALTKVVLADVSDTQSYVEQTTSYVGGARTGVFTALDSGDTSDTRFVNGKRTTLTLEDADDNADWATRKYTYAADGQVRTSLVQTNDNGDILETQFVSNGSRSSFTFTDVAGNLSLHDYTYYYDASGALSRQTGLWDNGDSWETFYSLGKRTRTVISDADDNEAWATRESYLAADGATLTRLLVTEDDSDIIDTAYAGGKPASRLFVDNSHSEDYAERTLYFAADGRTITRELVTRDNGDLADTMYVNGKRASLKVTDASGTSPFAEYTNFYDILGRMTRQTALFDEGNTRETTYINGKILSRTVTDADSDEAMTSHTYQYNPLAGGVISERVAFDDGTELRRTFVAGTTFGGGTTNDELYGATGADTFLFTQSSGHDTIKNFEDGLDRLNVEAFGFTTFAQVQALTQELSPTRIRLNLSASVSVEIEGLSLANFDVSDFSQVLSGGGGGVGGVGGGTGGGGTGGGGGGPGGEIIPQLL